MEELEGRGCCCTEVMLWNELGGQKSVSPDSRTCWNFGVWELVATAAARQETARK